MPTHKSLKKAWMESPGPQNLKEAFILYFKGMLMGIADLIPGVSGGTIAFIIGIYENFLNALASINKDVVKALFKFDLGFVIGRVHTRFLICLVGGILSSILIFSRLMHYLLTEQTLYTWAFFFGLVLISVYILGREVKSRTCPRTVLSFIMGAFFAWSIVGMIPIQTPENLWFIALCGMISISAMILPGISGSFLLLMLGKYAYITGALKNITAPGSISIIIVFICGTVIGLGTTARILSYFYKKYTNLTIAFLSGVLLGSLRKLWPWKETLETVTIGEKVYILREQNILPSDLSSGNIMIISFILVGIATGAIMFFQQKPAEKR